VDFPDFTRRL